MYPDEDSYQHRLEMRNFCFMHDFSVAFNISSQYRIHEINVLEGAQRYRDLATAEPATTLYGCYNYPGLMNIFLLEESHILDKTNMHLKLNQLHCLPRHRLKVARVMITSFVKLILGWTMRIEITMFRKSLCFVSLCIWICFVLFQVMVALMFPWFYCLL